MNILFIGDVNDEPGLRAMQEMLPGILKDFCVDFVIANGENSANGLGLTPESAKIIFDSGADIITLGNHTWSKKEILKIIDDPRIVRPINYPAGAPGQGMRIAKAKNGARIAVLNALGRESLVNVLGRETLVTLDDPFKTISDRISEIEDQVDMIFVDIHGESAIEKKTLAYFLDGRVTAIVGTHTHVQTADEQILPKGSAYITDVGMTGSFDSVVGIKKELAIEQYCTQRAVRYFGALGEIGLNAVMINVDENDRFRAKKIVRVFKMLDDRRTFEVPYHEMSEKLRIASDLLKKEKTYRSIAIDMTKAMYFSELETLIRRALGEITGITTYAIIDYDISSKSSIPRVSREMDEETLRYFEQYIQENAKSESAFNRVLKLGERHYYIYPFNEIAGRKGIMIMALPAATLEESWDFDTLELFREFLAHTAYSYNDLANKFVQQQKIDELSSLYEVGRMISESIELDDLLDNIMAAATKVMNSETSSVLLIDEKTNELTFKIAQGEKGEEVKRLIRLKVGQGIAGWVAETGETCIVPDTSKDPRFYKEGDQKTKFVTKSIICVPLRHKDKIIGVLEVLNRKGDVPFNEHDAEMLKLIANQCVNPIVNAQLYENIKDLYKSTIRVLANAMDAKDPYTHGHSRRVAEYAKAIAEEIQLPKKEIDELEFAALLHDIGKIGIRDNILCKPGKLTDEEFKIIQMHPEISAQILAPVSFLADKIPIVKHHHEKYNGKGYPDGLAGNDIPLGARIIAIADTFDAMTSHRSYRRGLPAEVAIEEIKRCSGTQFDPALAEAFINVFKKRYEANFEEIRSKFEEQEKIMGISINVQQTHVQTQLSTQGKPSAGNQNQSQTPMSITDSSEKNPESSQTPGSSASPGTG